MATNYDKEVFNYSQYENAGWRQIRHFGEDTINNIKVELKGPSMPRTAVPSPYARLELMQKAFGNVSSLGDYAEKPDKILVSQALDILQLVFEGINDPNLRVVKWHLHGATDRLISAGEKLDADRPGLRLFGRTLRDYAKRETYGMRDSDQADNIEPTLYILALGDTPMAMTSPTSIFLPTPNFQDPRWGSRFSIEGRIPIFSETRNLIDRDPEFIKFVFVWWEDFRRKAGGTPEPLREFSNYLSKQRTELSNREKYQLVADIDAIASADIDTNYDEATIGTESLDVLGYKLYKIKPAAEQDYIRDNSDLVIKPSVAGREALPLVLSTNIEQRNLKYTSANTFWDSKESNLDYNDDSLRNTEPSKRTLPNGKSYKGGFIYEHDLLSDQLWLLPYNLNDECFEKIMTANEPDGFSFLPPVTPLFFKYFDLDYLKKNMRFEVKAKSVVDDRDEVMSVTVTLDINVRGGIIRLKKNYQMADTITEALEGAKGSPTQATGMVMEVPVGLSIFPFVRFENPKMNDYAVQLVREPDFDSQLQIELEAYTQDTDGYYQKIDGSRAKRRMAEGQYTVRTYDFAEHEIKYFMLSIGGSDAILMPKWGAPYKGGQSGLIFSFDFGTSNTFVAVSDTEGKENPAMNFQLPVKLMANTMADDPGEHLNDIMVKSFNDYVAQDLLPFSRKDRPFPLRSVLSASKKELDGNESNTKDYEVPFLKSSIPFVIGYEDYGIADNRIISNLKWLMDRSRQKEKKEDAKRVPAFINELMFLARAYAVSKEANLQQCKVIWTYPVSMKRRQKRDFKEIWEEAYKKYFDPKAKEKDMVVSLPESVAPMFKQKKQRIDGVGLSIDIGGGTCDVVVYNGQDEDKWKISSFRFGAENIFGIDLSAEEVPMVREALSDIKEEIVKFANSKNDLTTRSRLMDIANKLPAPSSPMTDVTSALFALADQPLLKDISDAVSFNKWLQKHYEYHYLIYFYYGAILYYVTQLILHLNETDDDDIEYDEPEMVFFSGSGSKILNIISEERKRVLEDLTETMLNHFSRQEFDIDDFDVNLSPEPKEVTARGALSGSQKDMERFGNNEDNSQYVIRYFMIKDIDGKLSKKNMDITVETIAEHKEEAVNAVVDYLELFENFVKKNTDNFDIDEDSANAFLDSLKKHGEWNRKKFTKILTRELNEYEEGEEVPDSPFFAILQSLLFKELKNDKDND